MAGFTRLTATAALLPGANIDTDVIMPKQFLKGIDRAGLARGLFHDLRFAADGARRAGFVLNRPGMADCRILLTGPNFGCGSSREHAVWGMLQYGIRAVIGTSFGAIFADNAANNGLLLISLAPDALANLMEAVAGGAAELTIDLESQQIVADALTVPFAIEKSQRRAIMLGLDRIGETLMLFDRIRAFEADYLAAAPWLLDDQPG
ncbi:3-isopropylmalate dehydratase small subunit [Novosphingobium sp.]|uniref:3-isopropylmalate dehydratase small subunit n=1 Tax=Novosphingobium sp. TaxID=1874826 RepID=UPI00333E96CA